MKTAHLTRRLVYCSKHAMGKYSVCDTFDDDSENIRFDRTEHDRTIAETKQIIKETDALQKETGKHLQALGVKIDKVTANVGGLNNDIGDFAEGLLTTDLLEKFKALNLDFDDAFQNIEIRERGTKRVLAEIDCLLLNTDIALVAEVKAKMTRRCGIEAPEGKPAVW